MIIKIENLQTRKEILLETIAIREKWINDLAKENKREVEDIIKINEQLIDPEIKKILSQMGIKDIDSKDLIEYYKKQFYYPIG